MSSKSSMADSVEGGLRVCEDGDGGSERRDREASARCIRWNNAVTPPLRALTSRL